MTLGGLGERLEDIQHRVQEALILAGRKDSAEIIVVTKNHPAELVRDLASLGVRNVGENRHQEASQKRADLLSNHAFIDDNPMLSNLKWHFIGQLQSNKAKAICEWADVIHSIDSLRTLTMIAEHPRKPAFFLQYSADEDQDRSGLAADALLELAAQISENEQQRLQGVMMVAPLNGDSELAFAQLQKVSEQLQSLFPHAKYISAGMSEDFEIALQYGATHLRIGTAITGKRMNSG